MKKIIFLFIASTFLFGCETTDNELPTASIVGTWNGITIDFTGTGATEVQGVPVTATLVGSGYDIDYTITFTEDPNNVTSIGSISAEATASFLGQSYTEYEEGIDVSFSSPWSLDGDTLTLTIEGEEVIANVTELTETTLVLQFGIVRTEMINDVSTTVTLDVTASFSRL